MKKNKYLLIVVITLLAVCHEVGHVQSQSEYALIRKPVFQNPMIWRLTRDVTKTYWDINLFNNPLSGAQSYIMTPWYELWSGVSFHLDYAWNRMVYFETLDNWIRAYSSQGSGTCQLWWPESIDVLAPFNDEWYSIYYYIYVADTRNSRIVRLKYNWQNQNILCYSPISGGGLEFPHDLDLNDGGTFHPVDDDYLWVISDRSQIKRFTIDGVLRSTFGDYGCDGQAGYFCYLTAIVSGRSALLVPPFDQYANSTHFYIADVGNNRIVWLIKETNGEMISWMKEVPISSSVVDLEVDSFGQLWAVDKDAGRVTKYTYDLFPLCTYGSPGTGEDQFWQPVNISNTGGYLGCGNMAVMETWTDSSGGQYFGIGTDIVDLSINSSNNNTVHSINYTLIDPSLVTIEIHNQQGNLIKTLFNAPQVSGTNTFIWDGTNTNGEDVKSGEYCAMIIDTSIYVNIEDQHTPVNVIVKETWFHHNSTCCQARGNVDGITNAGGPVDVNDLTYLIAFLFQGGPPPPCEEEGNVDSVSGSFPVNIADMTYLVSYLFEGGQPPPPCP